MFLATYLNHVYIFGKISLSFGRIMAIENLNKHLILALIYMAREKGEKKGLLHGGWTQGSGPETHQRRRSRRRTKSKPPEPFFHW
jgi:hypothetical protein